ncbi:muramidase (flagellum-specific) [Brevibacillus sp. CF112]|uniref:glycoside hydrolase family 73 protein n=1 Tax=Brevibacillus sp. CF112 TaxID=1144311 RepID=UPI0002717F5B|nr:glucosaminidase domain-containing protein [Brevibacillus sp. CF112]EJL42490.1 muramidase (flagellum-specific) [Brevibacillus sp. CF112]
MTPKDFIQLIAPDAIKLCQESGIFASLTIAQACLETGYGKHRPRDKKTGRDSFNLFGVKWTGEGDYVTCQTWEVVAGRKQYIDAKFRAYPSLFESLKDHQKVLQLPRYKRVREAKTAEEAVMLLHPCGYATDPEYGIKLRAIIRGYSLTQYDLRKETPNVKPEIANEIIDLYLQAAWHVANEWKDEERTKRIGFLADQLRLASGQEPVNK